MRVNFILNYTIYCRGLQVSQILAVILSSTSTIFALNYITINCTSRIKIYFTVFQSLKGLFINCSKKCEINPKETFSYCNFWEWLPILTHLTLIWKGIFLAIWGGCEGQFLKQRNSHIPIMNIFFILNLNGTPYITLSTIFTYVIEKSFFAQFTLITRFDLNLFICVHHYLVV